MKKCVKKIPKYNGGTGGVAASVYNVTQKDAPNIFNSSAAQGFNKLADEVDLTLNQLNPFQTEMNWAEMNNKLQTGSVLGAVGTAVNLASNSIGKEATWQGAVSGALQGASAGMLIGGPWGALIGGVAGAGLASIGTGGDVNMNTGEITMPSGIAGMFGHSKGYLRRKSNMVKNALASRTLTENLRTDYYNNTRGAGSINVLAAEGGIMRQPVLAKVSPGELRIDPVTLKYEEIPGDGGKPNDDDNVTKILGEGEIIASNAEHMKMPNGKTPADNAKTILDSNMSKQLKKKMIKKLTNWQEANKTNSTNLSKYSKGTSYVQLDKDPINKLEEELFKPQTPEITGKDRRWIYRLAKTGETMSDYLPMVSALLKNYDYQHVQPRIGRNHNIPVDYNINDILIDNQLAHAINNYNISQMGGSTGAYLAAAGQSASNLAKANSKARIHQKNKQNELIARNIAQLNDWERYANNQLWTADVATAQNQGMAQQMRDQAIKDAYEYQTGRRNDRWKLSMLEPLFQYAVDDNIWKKFKMV